MSTQNNFRLSRTKNNILYILSGAALVLFAGLMLFPTINETTHAEGDEPDDGIAITVNGEVDANLVLFDEGDYKIAKDTVSVSSSAAYGYELFLTTDSEAHQSIYLNDDPTSESRIAPVSGTIAEPATLTNNTWGFAIAGQGNFDDNYDPTNPDPSSRFAIIPTADDQQAVFENNAATAEDSIDFYYGIKVEPTLEVGEYTTSAEYTAIAIIPPLTAKAVLGGNKNLNFIYDRNTYTVGETYTDNIGETTIANVYEVPMDSVECTSSTRMPWYGQRNTITKVNIDQSFANAKPTGMCGWFKSIAYVADMANLQNINTSNVTDASYMFYLTGYPQMFTGPRNFHINGISDWDTSHIANMSCMFYYAGRDATTWDIGDLSGWNTSNVTDMSLMFNGSGYSATSWSVGNLGYVDASHKGWDTSSVVNMSGMFRMAGYVADNFSLNINGWDTGNVTDMSDMFLFAGRFSASWSVSGLSGLNTGSVINMSGMFNGAGLNATTWDTGDLGGWNTSNVTDMSSMFSQTGANATAWSIGDISDWTVSQVADHTNFIKDSGAPQDFVLPGGWSRND